MALTKHELYLRDYERNKEKYKARQRKRYSEKKDECKAASAKWRKENPARYKELHDNFLKRNPDYLKNYRKTTNTSKL